MAEREVQFIAIPAKVVTDCPGFAIDIGGSVVKIVYRTKEDYEDAKTKKEDENGRMRTVSFARADVQKAVEFIKKDVHMTHDGATGGLTPVFTTGVGCSQFATSFKEELKCTANNVMEFDCFVFSFNYLSSRLTRQQFLHEPLVDAMREPLDNMAVMLKKFTDLMASGLSNGMITSNTEHLTAALGKKDQVSAPSSEPLATAESIYPCLLVTCGSGFAFMKLEEDGTFNIIDGSNRGGRAFFGLGTLLTGCKDYEELIELASRGTRDSLDVNTSDLMGGLDKQSDVYSSFSDSSYNNIVYCFGKGVNASLDQFKREDLAAALLHYMTLDLVQSVSLTAEVRDVKHVFFCGSFVNSLAVRELVTREFTRRNAFAFMAKGRGPGIPFDFVKPGPYLGALGALINNVEHFLKVPSEVFAEAAAKKKQKEDDEGSSQN